MTAPLLLSQVCIVLGLNVTLARSWLAQWADALRSEADFEITPKELLQLILARWMFEHCSRPDMDVASAIVLAIKFNGPYLAKAATAVHDFYDVDDEQLQPPSFTILLLEHQWVHLHGSDQLLNLRTMVPVTKPPRPMLWEVRLDLANMYLSAIISFDRNQRRAATARDNPQSPPTP